VEDEFAKAADLLLSELRKIYDYDHRIHQ